MKEDIGAKEYVECSAMSGDNVEEVFNIAAKEALLMNYDSPESEGSDTKNSERTDSKNGDSGTNGSVGKGRQAREKSCCGLCIIC